jgi:hypothetical protein
VRFGSAVLQVGKLSPTKFRCKLSIFRLGEVASIEWCECHDSHAEAKKRVEAVGLASYRFEEQFLA